MQNLPPAGTVKRRKRYSRAVRFFRRIFFAPAGASTTAAGSHGNRHDDGVSLSTTVSSSAAMPSAVGEEQLQHQQQQCQQQRLQQQQQQHQQMRGCQHPHCRFHHQGPPGSAAAWTIEVTMPRCVSCQVAQAAAAAAAGASTSAAALPPRQRPPLTPSPSQGQMPTPTLTARKSPVRKQRTPTPPPPPVALLPIRRQSPTQLQAAASREGGEKSQRQDQHRIDQLLKQQHQHQLELQIKQQHQHQLELQIKQQHQNQLEQQIKQQHQNQLEQQIKQQHQHQLEQEIKQQHQSQLDQQIKQPHRHQLEQEIKQSRLSVVEKLQHAQNQLQHQRQKQHQLLHQLQYHLQHESSQQHQLHQSTPASKSFSAADQTEPIDLSGSGSRTRQHPISLREIDSASKSTSPLSAVHQETQVRSRQLPLVPRTLWLRSETATQATPLPTATPAETASTVTTAAAASPVAAVARAAANRRPLQPTTSLPHRSSGVAEGSTEAVRQLTASQLPPPPPPQLSKLRAPPVVVRAPQRSLTPSPIRGEDGGGGRRRGSSVRIIVGFAGGGGRGERGSGSGGGGGDDGGSNGGAVETASATGSTQSSGPTPPRTRLQVPSSTGTASVIASASMVSSTSAVSTRPPTTPFLGRVAETVRRFNSIRPSHTTGRVVTQASSPIRLAKSFRSVAADAPTVSKDTVKSELDPPVSAGPSAAVTSTTTSDGGPRTSPSNKPRPHFGELLAKFESFDRKRRECLAKAEAAAVQAATAETTTASTIPQPLAEGPDVRGIAEAAMPAASSSKEDLSTATTDELPAADVVDTDGASLTDDNDAVDTGPDERDLAEAAEAPLTAVVDRRPSTLGRSLRLVLLCLVGLFLGHAVLRLLLTFESELAQMRSQL